MDSANQGNSWYIEKILQEAKDKELRPIQTIKELKLKFKENTLTLEDFDEAERKLK